jgi:hypothetical protein
MPFANRQPLMRREEPRQYLAKARQTVFGGEVQRQRFQVDVPSEDTLVGDPASIPFQHLPRGGHLLAVLWVLTRQGAQGLVNCHQRGAHDSVVLATRLGQQQKVISIHVNLGNGWSPCPTKSGRIGGQCERDSDMPAATATRQRTWLRRDSCREDNITFAVSYAVSVKTVKYGGDSTQPIGRARGK